VVEAIADLDPIAVTSLFPLTGNAAAAVAAAGVPQIHLGSSQLHAIGTLHLSVGEMRVAHLASRGHSRLAFAYSGAPKWRPLGDYWLRGVLDAARNRDLPEVAVAEITARDATDVVTGWVNSGVTAVCAQSDDTALIVLHGVREAGLRCPQDLAVMGVDAIPAGEVSAPPLTTIRFDATAIVDVAVAAMMSELGYPESGEEPTTADVATLIQRAST
jgi:DNA-binding LacI/PurR family transcriptional regulator